MLNPIPLERWKQESQREATSFPWFAIVSNGARTIHAGVWFTREAATLHLKANPHRFPKTAFVYAFSGQDSDLALFE